MTPELEGVLLAHSERARSRVVVTVSSGGAVGRMPQTAKPELQDDLIALMRALEAAAR